jgi:prepilin-type N-terminal cleavage/methylation domain-containing protein
MDGGFTLLELLIVIAILAILGAIVVFMLNPTETLKKARDSQRISDLSTIKTALGIYLTSTSSPKLDGGTNTLCIGASGGQDTIWYSKNGVSGTVATDKQATSTATEAALGLVDGTGWVPVNLSSLIGGSPISSFPIDPINTVAGTPTSTDLVYRYSCKDSPLGFEINAQLESNAFTVEDNKRVKDGGNNPNLYEVGSDLTILPASSDF